MSKIDQALRAIAMAVTVTAATLSVAVTAGARQAAPTAPAVKAPAPAPTSATAAKPLWKELSRPQQVALDPLQGEWDQMEALRKQKWMEIANRYASMKPDEQLRVHERMRAWLKLTPEERRVARENYTLSKKLDKGQKSAKWEQYQQLPEEEKRKLAADAATKKHVTNLPPKSQPKAVAPVKPALAPVTNPPPGTPPAPVPNAK